MITKAITLHPEHAQAIVDGHKWIETRPSPPNGNMRPDGVRGLPGCTLHGGESVAIHRGGKDGAIVAFACVADAALICTPQTVNATPPWTSAVNVDGDWARLTRYRRDVRLAKWDFSKADVSDQLPFGDFSPGRWAWLLEAIVVLDEPIPCKGKQGVWRLPDDLPGREMLRYSAETASWM